MKKYDELSDSLAEETVSEMAQTFFGRRREIERLSEDIERLASDVRLAFDDVCARAAGFLSLMPGEEAARETLRAVGADPEPLLAAAAAAESCDKVRAPFALTLKGRWIKTVMTGYEALGNAIETYTYGRYVDDPRRPGRKLLTPHLEQLERLVREHNKLVETANVYETPSSVLGFLRGLDPQEMDKERITGATLEGWAQDLDSQFTFEPLDMAALAPGKLPGLPLTDEVRKSLKRSLDLVYSNNKDRIARIMERSEENA